MTKFIFITGGVVSSLGKGITSASLALLLKRRGYKVAMQKLDPYLNIDPGTMSPYQHGEVFVTEDGAETDLDLGHYERFAGIHCSKLSNFTSGKIYSNVLNREREGGYLGGTVQVIPHITDEIKQAIQSCGGPDIDIALIEIGGTAGDIESLPFLEAARQFRHDAGENNTAFIHLTLLTYLRAAKELKTKPSQQSVGILRNIGIFPDLLICRSEVHMEEEHCKKLSLFCNVPVSHVIEECDVANSIYEVPINLAEQNLDTKVLKLLDLPITPLKIDDWHQMINSVLHPQHFCTIAIIGKYSSCKDAYKSIYEAINHSGIILKTKITILCIEAEDFEHGEKIPDHIDGLIIAGGFGKRGIEGKIATIQQAREKKIPILGICLGMQCMVIEYARHILGYTDANSSEFDEKTQHPIIHLMNDQRHISNKGGTMRLGSYPCEIKSDSKTAEVYHQTSISERHRHRYEFNNLFRDEFNHSQEMRIVGTSPDEKLVEIVEIKNHPFFIGCQFHPEFQSQLTHPHELFIGLTQAALKNHKEKENAKA